MRFFIFNLSFFLFLVPQLTLAQSVENQFVEELDSASEETPMAYVLLLERANKDYRLTSTVAALLADKAEQQSAFLTLEFNSIAFLRTAPTAQAVAAYLGSRRDILSEARLGENADWLRCVQHPVLCSGLDASAISEAVEAKKSQCRILKGQLVAREQTCNLIQDFREKLDCQRELQFMWQVFDANGCSLLEGNPLEVAFVENHWVALSDELSTVAAEFPVMYSALLLESRSLANIGSRSLMPIGGTQVLERLRSWHQEVDSVAVRNSEVLQSLINSRRNILSDVNISFAGSRAQQCINHPPLCAFEEGLAKGKVCSDLERSCKRTCGIKDLVLEVGEADNQACTTCTQQYRSLGCERNAFIELFRQQP